MTELHTRNVIEAALLAAGKPLQPAELAELFDEGAARPTITVVQATLAALAEEYSTRGIELKETAAGFRIQVRPVMSNEISRLWPERPPKYSRALLETLAIIAYRQPITRAEIEAVRGVAVNPNIVKTVIERNWVHVVGHRDVPGRPELLGTTRDFLDYFGLKRLDELPPLAEIKALGEIKVQFDLPDPGQLPAVAEGSEGAPAVAAGADSGVHAAGSESSDSASSGEATAGVAAPGEAAAGGPAPGEAAAVGPAIGEAVAGEHGAPEDHAAPGEPATSGDYVVPGGHFASGDHAAPGEHAASGDHAAPGEHAASGDHVVPGAHAASGGHAALGEHAASDDHAAAVEHAALDADASPAATRDGTRAEDAVAQTTSQHAVDSNGSAVSETSASSAAAAASEVASEVDAPAADQEVAHASSESDAPTAETPAAPKSTNRGSGRKRKRGKAHATSDTALHEAEEFVASVDADLAGDDDSSDEEELSAAGPDSSELVAGPRDIDN